MIVRGHDVKLSKMEKQVELNEAKIMDMDVRMDHLLSKKDYEILQEKLDQENRSRRNNIVLHNVPEGAEEAHDCSDFVKNFIINHMKVEHESKWEIERAHRSPTGPPSSNRVRPIHVKFLRHADRVEVLKAAPKKLKDNPIVVRGKQIK